MKHGKYIRGWKFDWDEANRDFDHYMNVGREMMAASCADPGCCSCPQCGEFYWREYEVFECARCGAECAILNEWPHDVKAGPPQWPEKCRPRLYDGMRVRYAGRRPGLWCAGRVPIGTLGTIRYRADKPATLVWRIEWDGITAKDGYEFGTFGPFLGDNLEIAQ